MSPCLVCRKSLCNKNDWNAQKVFYGYVMAWQGCIKHMQFNIYDGFAAWNSYDIPHEI